ncbi:uncharacterized protein F4822DRAFT_433723 [Hypoxylon trugodes]|uniref:uncharacterized protein n=1 Tax=Hypoxylon trugodes TaxID=326681 RepID=UPI00219D2157|nr:uncharacterized protein F4822DRAFT_433723 [Hypoxylon trugodes]KAI1383783.1 hypothetical protein F4822DRAFT_433723 [Hypoxylon trugodes]
MALKLHELTNDEDLISVLEVGHEAYGNPYNGVWQITTGSSREECYTRLLSWHKNDPSSHWVFVTDEATGEVIGGTLWKIFETNPYATPMPAPTIYWLPEVITYCFVHSSHRGRGAASLMLKWGTDKADELRLEAFVESTDIARKAYERHGFNVIHDLDIDAHMDNPSEEFSAMREKLGCPMHGWFMKRDPVSS